MTSKACVQSIGRWFLRLLWIPCLYYFVCVPLVWLIVLQTRGFGAAIDAFLTMLNFEKTGAFLPIDPNTRSLSPLVAACNYLAVIVAPVGWILVQRRSKALPLIPWLPISLVFGGLSFGAVVVFKIDSLMGLFSWQLMGVASGACLIIAGSAMRTRRRHETACEVRGNLVGGGF
jgi:hypothetical protein